MVGENDVYGEPIVYEYPGAIIRVRHPILTDEERARRMKELERAAAELIKHSNLNKLNNAK